MLNICQNRKYVIYPNNSSNTWFSLLHSKYVVIDCETTGLNPRTDHIVGIGLATDTETGIYVDWSGDNKLFIQTILSDDKIHKIFHNAVFDLSMLRAAGCEVKGPIHDTMLLAHLLDPDREHHGLKELVRSLIGDWAITKDTEIQQWLHQNELTKKDLSKAPKQLLAEYGCEDVLNTYSLFLLFSSKLKIIEDWLKNRGFTKTPIDYYKEEIQPIIPVVVGMQLKGVKLDLEQTASRKTSLIKRITEIESQLKQDCIEIITKTENKLHARATEKRIARNKSGKLKKELPAVIFNWESIEHLRTLLFDVLKEPPLKKTESNKASLDIGVLEKYAERHPWLNLYIEYKELRKLVSTYLEGLLEKQESGIIHASFNLTGTATGRFSSSNPNLQNLPKHGNIKELFIPRPGYKFIYGDYSQLELRIAAHLSQDSLLLAAYQQGLDLHKETAATIYNVPLSEIGDKDPRRDVGKRVNFAIIYNASGWRIAEILGLMSELALDDRNGKLKAAKQGEEIIKRLFGKYQGLKKYVDKQMSKMLQYNCAVSELGYCRRLPGLKSEVRQEYNHSIKAGFNLPIQGMGASICKRAMIELHRKNYTIINQIHDAIVLEVSNEETGLNDEELCNDVKNVMEQVYSLTVPLVVEPKILTSFAER